MNDAIEKLRKDLETKIENSSKIVVSEDEPSTSCIWYKVLNTTKQEEITYELKTKAYDENEKYHLEQDNKLETIINITDDSTDNENIIVEEIKS